MPSYRTLQLLLAIAVLCLTAGMGTQALAEEEMAPAEEAMAPADETMAEGPTVEAGSALEVQILLSCANFSPGEIDGNGGDNTKGALLSYQKSMDLEATGEIDEPTLQALREGRAEMSLLTAHTLTEEDVSGPFIDSIPNDLEEQAELEALSYTSVTEKVAERFHVSPELLAKLNPEAKYEAGETLWVPATDCLERKELSGVSKITVSAESSSLTLTDSDGKVLFYAPVTAGSEKDPLPVGNWKVTAISVDPTFRYNPDLFWDAEPSDEKATLPPGPNNPVGKVWIDLDKEHYGIHGTPAPDKIGYTQSHGCVRLANWDAMYVATMVEAGTEVIFE